MNATDKAYRQGITVIRLMQMSPNEEAAHKIDQHRVGIDLNPEFKL